MSFHRKGKLGYQFSIDHYRTIFKNATFSKQVIEELSRNDYKNGVKCNDMF